MQIRPLQSHETTWAETLCTEHFALPRVVSRGVLHEIKHLPGLVAEHHGKRAGLMQYDIKNNALEVVIMIAIQQGIGVGRELLNAAKDLAAQQGCSRAWLITTNNNTGAIRFYQNAGWQRIAIHYGAVNEARKLKPEIPEFDTSGVPIRDEVEFEIKT